MYVRQTLESMVYKEVDHHVWQIKVMFTNIRTVYGSREAPEEGLGREVNL
jgi:hypothetical protein